MNNALLPACNRQRLDMVLGGADWEKVTQAAVREEYRLKRVGEAAVPAASGRKATYTIEEIEAMPFERARKVVMRGVSSDEFHDFSTGADPGFYPVAVATPVLQRALGSSAKVVRLSAADRDKQVRKGVERGRNRYELVQSMIDQGVILKYRDRAVSLYQEDGVWYHAAIQVTKAGDELYLKSLRRADELQLAKDRARASVIQEGRVK